MQSLPAAGATNFKLTFFTMLGKWWCVFSLWAENLHLVVVKIN